MCRWQWMKNLKYDLSWFSHSLFPTFEMILRAVAGQRSPRELSPRKSGGAHLQCRTKAKKCPADPDEQDSDGSNTAPAIQVCHYLLNLLGDNRRW